MKIYFFVKLDKCCCLYLSLYISLSVYPSLSLTLTLVGSYYVLIYRIKVCIGKQYSVSIEAKNCENFVIVGHFKAVFLSIFFSTCFSSSSLFFFLAIFISLLFSATFNILHFILENSILVSRRKKKKKPTTRKVKA